MKTLNEVLSRKTPTEKEISKKHKMPLSKVEAEVEKGEKVEAEHTKNDDQAEEIARDHIGEFPGYYSALKKMESRLKKK